MLLVAIKRRVTESGFHFIKVRKTINSPSRKGNYGHISDTNQSWVNANVVVCQILAFYVRLIE